MIHNISDNAIAVEINPKDWGFEINPAGAQIRFWTYADEQTWTGYIDIPKDKWNVLGRGNELDAKQWKEIVERKQYNDGEAPGLGVTWYYRDYPKELEQSTLFSAIDSGLSLLKSKNLSPLNVLILVRVQSPASYTVTNDSRPHHLEEFCGDKLKQFTGATYVVTPAGEVKLDFGDEIIKNEDGSFEVKKYKSV